MKNPNVQRATKQTFYNLTRRYGEPATLNRVTTHSVDSDTGAVTRVTESVSIRNVVRVPSRTSRNVLYTATMMQSMRAFAWQGSGQDVESTTFLIARRDARVWGDMEPSQWITYESEEFQVSEVEDFDGGWIVHCVIAKGSV